MPTPTPTIVGMEALETNFSAATTLIFWGIIAVVLIIIIYYLLQAFGSGD